MKVSEVSKLDLTIEITDTGIGIEKSQLDIVFESFHQAEGQNARKYGGTGLGLSITKRLVTLMGGSIFVKSTIGQGSTFTIKLRNVEVPAFQISKIKNKDRFNFTFGKSKILHVEDVEENRQLVALFLEDENIYIKEAETGKEALEILKDYTPDLILMDIQMPGLSGYETAEIIRKNKKWSSIPIIAITANATAEEKERHSWVFNEYLTKPISIDSLLQSVAKFLDSTKEKREFENTDYLLDLKAQITLLGTEVPKLKHDFNKKLLPLYTKVARMWLVDDLVALADKTKEIGAKYNLPVFAGYAENLKNAANIFDVEKINELRNVYTQFIEAINNRVVS